MDAAPAHTLAIYRKSNTVAVSPPLPDYLPEEGDMSLNRTHFSFLAFSVLLSLNLAVAEQDVANSPGHEKYKLYCAACHPLDPPPVTAPPVRGIVMHYRESVDDRDAFASAVADFVRAPSAQKSKFPPDAIKRFGLMPALPYPDDDIKEIALWMWSTVQAQQ